MGFHLSCTAHPLSRAGGAFLWFGLGFPWEMPQGAICDTSQRPAHHSCLFEQDSKCHLIKGFISEQGSSHSIWSGLLLPNFNPLKVKFLCSQQIKRMGTSRACFFLSQNTCLKQGGEFSFRETLKDQLGQGRCPTSRWLKQGKMNSHTWLRV